jgi:unsaturated rhamnogalacturonyl hydrolase
LTVTYLDENYNQLWDDTLMMTVLPLAQIGILLDRPHYIEEAKYQFLLHINYLMDAPTGLWFHGWEFTPDAPGRGGNNFAKALWARGNCWVTVAIPLFIEFMGDRLPAQDPVRRQLESAFRRQVDKLVECQDQESGLWHTLLVDPSSYLETSATAGFAAGILAGIRLVCRQRPADLSFTR